MPKPPEPPPEGAPVPPGATLPDLKRAAASCTACDLYERATQTVFGEGPPRAAVMFVGEQPGDSEDIAGRPFVGPAGKLLDQVLEEVGIDRSQVYVTNVVKHFKWIPAGKRRLHAKPKVLVCLGATAAQALLGRNFRVSRQRGELISSPLAPYAIATVHPSSLLRAPDEETRRQETERFVEDLRTVSKLLSGG